MSCLYTNLKFFTIQLIPRHVAVALLKCHVRVGCGHPGVRAARLTAICEVTSSSQVTDSSDMALVIVLCVCFRCCSVISGLTASAEAPLTVVQH